MIKLFGSAAESRVVENVGAGGFGTIVSLGRFRELAREA
jgi:hypothetical protein